MNTKAYTITTWIITGLISAMIIMSGVMKLTGGEQVVTGLTKVGAIDYIMLLGTMEIVFTALFLFPKTMKIGFLLVTCYFAGAIATDLTHSNPWINPAVLLAIVWVAAFMRDRQLFLPSAKQAV